MSLEQRLEDVNFLEKTAVNTIEDTILYLKAYCRTKEQFSLADEHYQNAKDFMKEYRRCRSAGRATEQFMSDLMTNMLLSSTGRIFRKSVPYLLGATVSAGLVYWAYDAGNLPLAIAGAVVSFGTVVTAFLVPRCEYHDTMLIYQAMAKHPEVVDKALKRLYEKEKNV